MREWVRDAQKNAPILSQRSHFKSGQRPGVGGGIGGGIGGDSEAQKVVVLVVGEVVGEVDIDHHWGGGLKVWATQKGGGIGGGETASWPL